MEVWLTILGMAAVTYATRALPLLFLRQTSGGGLEKVLQHIPPAILAALVAPALFAPAGHLEAGAYLWAGLVGLLIAALTRNVAVTLVVGLGLFALLKFAGWS